MNSPAMGAEVRKICALTGAYGYVGSRIRQALEANDWRVVALSRRRPHVSGDLPWSLDGEHSITEDLRRRSVTALVHGAWDFAQVRWDGIERVNVQGSVRLFEEALAAGVRRIVFISSMSAYPKAHSLYGRAKMAVERAAKNFSVAVIRPGLVYGDRPGGVFGAMQQRVNRSSLIPIIGDGSYPQYLVHEDDVGAAVLSALNAESVSPEPISVAHPEPWPLRRLIEKIAKSQSRHVRLVPVPWWFIFGGLKLAEMMAASLAFRSDSVVSLVYPNPHPEFNCARLLGVAPRPFD
jgi:nucleoside-diphosphate-sugar epimerase